MHEFIIFKFKLAGRNVFQFIVVPRSRSKADIIYKRTFYPFFLKGLVVVGVIIDVFI